MIRKIVTAVILIPLAVIIVGFAVANRQAVTISFDPFSAAHPAYALTLPLFVIILLLVIVGVIIGGIAAWLRQGKWRSAARRAEAENHEILAENAQLRRRLDMAERPPATRGGTAVELRSRQLALRLADARFRQLAPNFWNLTGAGAGSRAHRHRRGCRPRSRLSGADRCFGRRLPRRHRRAGAASSYDSPSTGLTRRCC